MTNNSALVAGALFDFLGWLMCQEKPLTVSRRHNASRVVERLQEWATLRGFSLDEADVLHWRESLTVPTDTGATMTGGG